MSGDVPAEDAARALFARGAVREGLALLRGAVARDREEEGCAALLERAQRGDIEPMSSTPKLGLGVVDAWIRRGMLVEALALLSGTELGSSEIGHEWADLLGELLAPVPAHAEPTLFEMHRQLLSGGASVALTLLDERARREPTLPAWALRRLSLLRWMLLDNAGSAEHDSELPPAATALASAIAAPLKQRSLGGTLSAARAFASLHPDDRDAPRLVSALERLVTEIELHGSTEAEQARTLPMFGRPAAAMQLRMGNLAQAVVVYRKLAARYPEDPDPAILATEVETVLRAAAGEPLGGDELEGEPTRMTATFGDEPTDLELGEATDAEAPGVRLEHSGPHSRLPPIEAVAPMAREPAPPQTGEHSLTGASGTIATELERQGRFGEAEQAYRDLAELFPDEPQWARRAEAVRARRASSDGVRVLSILPVGRHKG